MAVPLASRRGGVSIGRTMPRAVLLPLACLVLAVAARAAEVPGEVFKSPDGTTLAYRLHVPPAAAKDRPLPLLVFLHGNGSQGDDLDSGKGPWMGKPWAFNDAAAQAKTPCFVLYPRCRRSDRWSRVEWKLGTQKQVEQTDSQRTLVALLDHLQATQPIDRRRIWLVGFSMGGYGTWDLITRLPDRFAAAVATAGGGDPATVTKALASLPVWAIHGEDDTTVPISGSEDMVKAMEGVGATVRFDRLPKGGKHMGPYKFIETRAPEILAWLAAQPPRPAR